MHPFGLTWLTLDQISLTVTVGDGGIGARLESTFTVGSGAAAKTFGLSFEVTGSPGSLNASITASVSSLSTSDVLALLSRVGIPLGGLILPEITITNLEVSISAGSDGVGFALGGNITFLEVSADLLLSFVAGPDGAQLILGIQFVDFSLGDLIPPLKDTLVDEFSLQSLALVLVGGSGGDFESSDLPAPVASFYRHIYGSDDFTLELFPGLTLVASIPSLSGDLGDALANLGLSDDPIIISGTIPIPGLGGSEIHLAVTLPPVSLPPEIAPLLPFLHSGQLSLFVDLGTSGLSVGINGKITIKFEEPQNQDEHDDHTHHTFLTFSITGEFGVGPDGLQITFSGDLEPGGGPLGSVEGPWVAPFDIQWLTIHSLGVSLLLVFSPTPPEVSIGLELRGEVDILNKNIGVVVALTIGVKILPAPPFVVPLLKNIAFQGTSTSCFGTTDYHSRPDEGYRWRPVPSIGPHPPAGDLPGKRDEAHQD